jgi:hypothetical protein
MSRTEEDTMTFPAFPAPSTIFGASRPESKVDAIKLYRAKARATLSTGEVVRPTLSTALAAVRLFDLGLGECGLALTEEIKVDSEGREVSRSTDWTAA